MEALDILFLTLSVCIALLTVFLSIALMYLVSILRDAVKISDKVEEIVEKVDKYITKPLLMTKAIVEFVAPFIQAAEEKVKPRKKRGK